jgi:hypothetical protein
MYLIVVNKNRTSNLMLLRLSKDQALWVMVKNATTQPTPYFSP